MTAPDPAHSIDLADAGERFALVQRLAEIGVFERDLRTGLLWWSPQMLTLFG